MKTTQIIELVKTNGGYTHKPKASGYVVAYVGYEKIVNELTDEDITSMMSTVNLVSDIKIKKPNKISWALTIYIDKLTTYNIFYI